MMKQRTYFAYGSNLNVEDWNRSFPQGPTHAEAFRAVGPAWLPDVRVAFTMESFTRRGGVLDLLPWTGSAVPGMLYEVTEAGWKALEAKEGASTAYQRVACTALDEHGAEILALTYIVRPERRVDFVRPSDAYRDLVCEGFEQNELEFDHVLRAARNEPSESGPGQVFVYDRLMRLEADHGLLVEHGLESALLAEAPGRLMEVKEGPVMVLSKRPRSWVHGELVRCRKLPALLGALDMGEGFECFGRAHGVRRRAIVQVGMMDGHVRLAWTYLRTRAPRGARVVLGGDWRLHRGIRRGFLEQLVQSYAQGDEAGLARALVARQLFPPADEERAVRELLPLAEALERQVVSERELAQIVAGRSAGVGPQPHALS